MRIKNWKKFQHFKNRRPPWIKLHRDILEQRDINLISDRSFRVLIGIWLLASEDEKMNGTVPPVDEIAFRLRKSESDVVESLQELKKFFVSDDINPISDGYQVDDKTISLARSRETETETEKRKKGLSKDKPQPPLVAESDDSDSVPWKEPPKKQPKKSNPHFSKKVGEQFESIKIECNAILKLPYKNGKKFNPYLFVQKAVNNNGHPEAIYKTLRQMRGGWDGIDTPIGWWNNVLNKYNGNFNEQDHTAQSQKFKEYIGSPKIKKLIQGIGGE